MPSTIHKDITTQKSIHGDSADRPSSCAGAHVC